MAFSPQMPNEEFLRDIFSRVDQDGSGHISCDELQKALSNGTWTPFNPETVRLMMGMFDQTNRGTIGFNDFGALWKYITDWQGCFRSFDKDNSGNIDTREFCDAIYTFGYRLGQQTIDIMMQKFDRNGSGTILFDDFIQCCIVLHNLTSSFRQLDTDQDGVITLKYDEFIHLALTTKT